MTAAIVTAHDGTQSGYLESYYEITKNRAAGTLTMTVTYKK
jgi:hypothetical protein